LLPCAPMMIRSAHADSRTYHLSDKDIVGGHKPHDLAAVVDPQRQHHQLPSLHLQIAMGWDDEHLNQFRIHGKSYGIAKIGGISFSDDPDSVRLKDLGLRINERFYYEYDFTDGWQHEVRLEAIQWISIQNYQRQKGCLVKKA
jgi:hypothetical protein